MTHGEIEITKNYMTLLEIEIEIETEITRNYIDPWVTFHEEPSN